MGFLGPRKGKEEAIKKKGPSPLAPPPPAPDSISGHPGEYAEKATVKLARPARDCVRLSATVDTRSCERPRAELARKTKRGDSRLLQEGGEEKQSGPEGREGGVAGLDQGSGS